MGAHFHYTWIHMCTGYVCVYGFLSKADIWSFIWWHTSTALIFIVLIIWHSLLGNSVLDTLQPTLKCTWSIWWTLFWRAGHTFSLENLCSVWSVHLHFLSPRTSYRSFYSCYTAKHFIAEEFGLLPLSDGSLLQRVNFEGNKAKLNASVSWGAVRRTPNPAVIDYFSTTWIYHRLNLRREFSIMFLL